MLDWDEMVCKPYHGHINIMCSPGNKHGIRSQTFSSTTDPYTPRSIDNIITITTQSLTTQGGCDTGSALRLLNLLTPLDFGGHNFSQMCTLKNVSPYRDSSLSVQAFCLSTIRNHHGGATIVSSQAQMHVAQAGRKDKGVSCVMTQPSC